MKYNSKKSHIFSEVNGPLTQFLLLGITFDRKVTAGEIIMIDFDSAHGDKFPENTVF
jgi:hypothetical protein